MTFPIHQHCTVWAPGTLTLFPAQMVMLPGAHLRLGGCVLTGQLSGSRQSSKATNLGQQPQPQLPRAAWSSVFNAHHTCLISHPPGHVYCFCRLGVPGQQHGLPSPAPCKHKWAKWIWNLTFLEVPGHSTSIKMQNLLSHGQAPQGPRLYLNLIPSLARPKVSPWRVCHFAS